MSKKTFIIIAAVLVILVGAAAYYFIFVRPSTNNEQQTPITIDSSSPFGTAGTNNQVQDDRVVNADGSVTIPVIALTHIYTDPTAGATIISEKGIEKALITDRATGFTYTFDFSNGLLTQTTNNEIPKIQEALWSTGGKNVVLRYNAGDSETINTYAGKLVLPTSTSTSLYGSITGNFLPSTISSLAVSPSNKNLVYSALTNSGSQIITANIDGTKAKTLYSSALKRWNVAWPTESTIALTSSPSSEAPGFLYFLSTSGSLTRILGNINGLTTVINPTASLVAYSDSTNSLSVYNTKTGVSSSLSINTLAEKCVWSKLQTGIMYCAVPTSIPSGNYPDVWYQGVVTFTDKIYKVNTITGSVTELGDLPGSFKQSIDAINLTLSPNEDYLLFINKKDLSLWSFAVTQ